MGAPSDQFLYLLWRPPYVLFSYYMGALRSFFCILYWGPQITFFVYYMGPFRSVSSHTIWGPLSDQFHCLLYGIPPPQISFFACYRGATSDSIFITKYMGASSDQFLRLLYGALLSLVSLITMWGPSDQFLCILFGSPSQISFFFYWMGSPLVSFFAYYRRPPQISLFAYYMPPPPIRSISSFTICGGPLG